MRSINWFGFVALGAAVLVGIGSADAATVKLDLGRHDTTNGHPTASPDVNGNYWNNLSPANGTSVIPINTTFGPFVTTANQPTAIGLKTTSGVGTSVGYWEANGTQNGGLLAPSSSLLGDFAIPTATEDYWFINQTGATPNQTSVTFDLTGLDPARSYDFRLFGTRDTSGVRTTRYTLTGLNSGTDTLQTSGPGSASATTPGYNGNNDTIVSINGITPTSLGVIQTRLEVVNGGFAYLGIMEISEVVPEPATTAAAVGALSVIVRRRRRA